MESFSPRADSLSVPREFKVQVTPKYGGHEHLSSDIWQNLYNVMYDITGEDLSTNLYNQDWQMAGLGVTISLSIPQVAASMPARYLVWAINYIATALLVNVNYKDRELTALLTWKGDTVGTLKIQKSAPAQVGLTRGPSPSTAPEAAANEVMDVTASYGRKIINEDEVWLTGIKATAQAAEGGLDTAVEGIVVTGLRSCIWHLTAGYGPILRNRHSREAIGRVLAWMAQDDKFQQIYIFIKIDGRLTAVGGFDEKT